MKVFVGSTGIERVRGGLESSFIETHVALKECKGLKSWLFKGSGKCHNDEFILWNISRLSPAASSIGKLIHRPNPYVIEQLSSVLPMFAAIKKHRPDIVFYSEVNLGMALYRLRPVLGGNFKLIYSNGGPGNPPFPFTDHVHQVAPYYLDLAVKANVPETMQTMIPHGISAKPITFEKHQERKQALRKELGLPLDRQVVLAVGWVSRTHKRADYIIREIATMKSERPFLLMLGRIDASSHEIQALAQELLDPSDYRIQSVSYEQVFNYYLTADLFIHAALKEGFGKVLTEALMHGLPCIAHDHPVMRYVLGSFGNFYNLELDDALAEAIHHQLKEPFDSQAAYQRNQYIRENFSWDVLTPRYIDMFKKVINA